MEQDPEAKGSGNSYTTEFRQYDPRIARWMSLDPMMGMFPSLSPYCAFNNNPVYYVDPLGLAAEGDPVKKSGSFSDNRKGIESDLPSDAKNGTKLEYLFDEGDYEKVTYERVGDRWEVVRYEKAADKYSSGSWRLQHHDRSPSEPKDADPTTTIAKAEPPTPDLNNKGGKDQAGTTSPDTKPVIETSSDPVSPATPVIVQQPVVPQRQNPPPQQPRRPQPRAPQVPNVARPVVQPRPVLPNGAATFVLDNTFFTAGSRPVAYNALRQISAFMAANPTQRFTVYINSTAARNAVIQNGPNAGMTLGEVNWQRYLVVRQIILNANPGINPANIGYIGKYNQPSTVFQVR